VTGRTVTRRAGTRRAGRVVRRGLLVALQALGLPAVLVAVWWLASDRSTTFYSPPLRTIVSTFDDTWFAGGLSGRLGHDILPSLLRLGIGYVAATVLGVSLGVLLGSSRLLRELTEPVLEFFRAIPPPVAVPVFILFAGIGAQMKVLTIVFGAIWPIVLNTVEGVRGVDEVLTDTARSYGITGWSRLRHLTLPAAGPQIVTGMRQALSIAIILMVISEMVAASNGLGYSIVQFQRSFDIPQMWSGIILLGLIGFVLSVLFGVFQSRALRWYHGVRQSERGRG
jgi:ABC-type nitrate/sulfonate/bicarbonate transport system permease component